MTRKKMYWNTHIQAVEYHLLDPVQLSFAWLVQADPWLWYFRPFANSPSWQLPMKIYLFVYNQD